MRGDFAISLMGPDPDVVWNGTDLPVAAVSIVQRRGEYPHLTVELDASRVTVDGAGELQAVSTSAGIVQFLADVDPKWLEETVMAMTPYNDNPFENALTVLKERAADAER